MFALNRKKLLLVVFDVSEHVADHRDAGVHFHVHRSGASAPDDADRFVDRIKNHVNEVVLRSGRLECDRQLVEDFLLVLQTYCLPS